MRLSSCITSGNGHWEKLTHQFKSLYGVIILGIFLGVAGELLVDWNNQMLENRRKGMRSQVIDALSNQATSESAMNIVERKRQEAQNHAAAQKEIPLYRDIWSILVLEIPIVGVFNHDDTPIYPNPISCQNQKGIAPSPSPNNDESSTAIPLQPPLLGSGDSTQPVMVAARTVVTEQFSGTNVLYGGAGNKILATAFGCTDGAIQHKYGGPWDTCAPQAILQAMGGTMTDFFGEPMQVYTDPKRTQYGYIVTAPPDATNRNVIISHSKLSKAILEQPEVQAYREKVSK